MKQTDRKAERLGGLVFVLMLMAQTVVAQSSSEPRSSTLGKPAWQWTIEERLAKRFDPAEMKERAAAEDQRLQELMKLGMLREKDVSSRSSEGDVDTISGRETPELFLPMELFNVLLDSAFPPDGLNQDAARASIEEHAAALGFGADFWRRLGRISSPFLEIRREHARQAIASKSAMGDERLALSLCRSRAEAMVAAKAEFGEEDFLRLLYEVVAPSLSKASRIHDKKAAAENLERIEGGCR